MSAKLSRRGARQLARATRMMVRESPGSKERRIVAANHVSRMACSLVLLLAGCATGDAGQVKEVGPGTYKIATGAGGNSVLIGGHDATDAAVEQAGQYCHAKGQKLVVVPTQAKDVTFHCGDAVKADQ
jgi:hypothetical protein